MPLVESLTPLSSCKPAGILIGSFKDDCFFDTSVDINNIEFHKIILRIFPLKSIKTFFIFPIDFHLNIGIVIRMNAKDISKYTIGDTIYWNDPDDGKTSRYFTIADLKVEGDIVKITSIWGDYIECLPEELS